MIAWNKRFKVLCISVEIIIRFTLWAVTDLSLERGSSNEEKWSS